MVWDDLEIASQEVHHSYAALLDKFAVDRGRTVTAGHSMGGEVAIWLALSGTIPAAGFLAVGPSGPNMNQPESWQVWIDQAVQRQAGASGALRGCVIAGEADTSCSIEFLSYPGGNAQPGGYRLPGSNHPRRRAGRLPPLPACGAPRAGWNAQARA